MTSSDIWYCSQDAAETQWTIKDNWSISHGPTKTDISLNGTYDLYDTNITVSNEGVSCYFKRKLNTGDPNDLPLERGKNIKVCSYSANTTTFSKHLNQDVRYCFYWPLIDGYQGELLAEE